MKQFSMGNAWSSGVNFFAGNGVNHAIILIGMGIVVPFVLQMLLVGQATGMMNPAMMGQGGVQALAAAGGAFLLVSLISYDLQFGSYFGSWRLGFGADENLGGAIIYGLIAAAISLGIIILFMIVVGLIGGFALQGASGGAGIGIGIIFLLVILVPLLVFLAVLMPLMIAVFCVIMFIVMLLGMAFGVNAFGQDPRLAMLGGGAFLVVMLLAALLFWLTARLCCTTSVMARRKSYNFIEAMGESWRLTARAQGQIMLYFLLLGIVGLVLFIVLAMVVGASMMGGLQSGSAPQVGMGSSIIGMIFGIPLAYASVLVPAGIYRELGDFTESARVFA
jgi:hypothetical protein